MPGFEINRIKIRTFVTVFVFVLVPAASALQAENSAQSVVRQEIECIDGMAAGYQCDNVNLLSIVTPAEMGATETCTSKLPSTRCLTSDMWGWFDSQTGKEYAIVGREDGTSFIDVTDPLDPVYVGTLPLNGSRPSYWRDMKVYKDYVYIVADASAGNGIQILDLKKLRDFAGTPISFQMSAHYDQIGAAHNIVINEETGFAYVVGASGISCQGLYMLDLSNPLSPQFAGCHMEEAPRSSYTHDAQCVTYAGPDTDYSGREICLMANENAVVIADVTEKNAVRSISSMAHPSATYVHQGWLTGDHKYFIQNDELDELQNFDVTNTRTIIWDIADLDDPMLHTVYDAEGTSIDHNLYVRDSYVFQSNYTDGLHILDLSNPSNPYEVGFFDTHTRMKGSPGYDPFDGTWSNYPFFKSGAIAISSFEEGLFMVRPDFSSGIATEPIELLDVRVRIEAYPNPFVDYVTLTLLSPETEYVRISLFDALGREIELIASRVVTANTSQQFEVDLSDLPAGTYFYIVVGETFDVSKTIFRIN